VVWLGWHCIHHVQEVFSIAEIVPRIMKGWPTEYL